MLPTLKIDEKPVHASELIEKPKTAFTYGNNKLYYRNIIERFE